MGTSKLDASSVEEVEDALIGADLGTKSAARLAGAMRKHKFDEPVTSDSLAAALADLIAEILRPVAIPLCSGLESATCFAVGWGEWFGQDHYRW